MNPLHLRSNLPDIIDLSSRKQAETTEGNKTMFTISNELLEEIGQEVEGSVRTDYSGRGMYGDSCVGIVASDLLELGAAISRLVEDEELRDELISNSRTDSMGYDTIAYWPRVTCNDAEDEDEDED